jgi:hypothetical protein
MFDDVLRRLLIGRVAIHPGPQATADRRSLKNAAKFVLLTVAHGQEDVAL